MVERTTPTRAMRLLSALKRHPLAAWLAAIMAVVTALSVVLELPSKVEALLPDAPKSVQLADDQLAEKSNGRYGFTVTYPIGWVRDDPDNGDGYVFHHPSEPFVEIRAYGTSAAIVSDARAEVASGCDDGIQQSGGTVELCVYDGAQLSSEQEGVRTLTDAAGWRTEFTTPATESQPEIRVLSRSVLAGDHIVTFRAQAPTNDWDRWSDEFTQLTGTLRVNWTR